MSLLKLITYKKILRIEKLNKKGEAPVSIRCYQNINGKPTVRFLPTGITLPPSDWDSKRLTIKRSYPNADQLNTEIDNVIRKAKAFEVDQRHKFGVLSVNRIREYADFKQGVLSFTEFMKQEIRRDDSLTESTKRARRVTLRKLIEYSKGKKIYFDQINYTFVVGFDRFLRLEGYHPNYIHKQHKIIKRYLRLASFHNLFDLKDSPYNNFSAKTIPSKINFLLPDELKKIEALTFDPEEWSLEKTRDMFLLQCYLSMRFGEVKAICKGMIEESHEGLILRYRMEKNQKLVDMPVYAIWKPSNAKMSKPEALLRKYLDRNSELYRGTNEFDDVKIFDIVNQTANIRLKTIAKRAGLKKRLHTHVARHTFTTLAAPKLPFSILQAILRHSDPRTTMRYLHNNSLMLAEELKKANWDF